MGGTRIGRWLRVAGLVALTGGVLAACSSSSSGGSGADAVLLVGTFHGKAGAYKTIQSAVDAAKAGDWILIAPGDYHETADADATSAQAQSGDIGGVEITTDNLHLRGMDRSTVVVDGTKAGSSQCSNVPSDQTDGRKGSDGKDYGRNGIVVFEASGVSIDNMTACNFMAGTGQSGNEFWWNGGAGTGKVGGGAYEGSYLTATSTSYGNENTAAQYGIFSSNSSGPSSWNQIYSNNFNDSGMYVGGCQQQCDVTIDHAWMENNALGYSGTNSGGAVEIENSQFDDNKEGVDTNTQIGGDPPPPQNGDCPDGATSAITHTHSCWVFIHNDVHNNNNPNVPEAGSASAGPVGTGMTISGGTNDTVMDNTFADNDAWGFLFVPYPDSDTPAKGVTCSGSGGFEQAPLGCIYDPKGDALLDNTFTGNGSYGNPSNGDYGQIVLKGGSPQNCFAGNISATGSVPPGLEQSQPTCGPTMPAANSGGALLGQVLCDTGFGTCSAGQTYPKPTNIVMPAVPTTLPTMPNPCAGVPSNPWCPSGHPLASMPATGSGGHGSGPGRTAGAAPAPRRSNRPS